MNQKWGGGLSRWCGLILLVFNLSGTHHASAQGTITFPGTNLTSSIGFTNLYTLTNYWGSSNLVLVSWTNPLSPILFPPSLPPIVLPPIEWPVSPWSLIVWPTNASVYLPSVEIVRPPIILPPIVFPPLNTRPANDHFANALVLYGYSTNVTGANFLATYEPGEPAHEGHPAWHSSWWRWAATEDGVAELTTTDQLRLISTNPLILYRPYYVWVGVYTGDELTNLVPVTLLEGSSTNIGTLTYAPKTYRFEVEAGVTYQVATDCESVFGFNFGFENLSLTAPTVRTNLPGNLAVDLQFIPFNTNAELAWLGVYAGTNLVGIVTNAPYHFLYTPSGPGEVSVSAIASNSLGQRLVSIPRTFTFRPANDDFADATIVAGEATAGAFGIDTALATSAEGDPELIGGAPGHSVWWRWTPRYSAETLVTLSSKTSALGVYQGESLQNLQQICFLQTGNVSLPGYGPASVSFAAEAGKTYSILVQSDTAVTWSFDQQTMRLTPSGSKSGNVGQAIPLQVSWLETDLAHSDVELVAGNRSWVTVPPYFYPSVLETGRLGVATSPELLLNWLPQESGQYVVWARGTNSLGGRRESPKTDFIIFAANDPFALASTIPSQTRQTNFVIKYGFASAEPGEPAHKTTPAGRSLWWQWTPLYSGNVRMKAVQEMVGLPLDVFTGSSLADLRTVAANDRTAYLDGRSGAIRLHVRAGQTYFIRVDDTRPGSPQIPGGPVVVARPPPIVFSLEPVKPLPGELLLSSFKAPIRPTRQPVMQIARVLAPGGHEPISDPDYVAQLYAGPSKTSLQAMGSAQKFLQDPGQLGMIAPTPVLVTNVVALQRVFAQVRVWNSRYGNSYEAARANGSPYGESAVLSLIAGSEEIGPAPLSGLSSFSLKTGNGE